MTKKTLTNRITAPQHLLDAYATQQAALTGSGGATTGQPLASAGLPPRAPSAPTPAAAAAATGAAAGTGDAQQQQQQVSVTRQQSAALSGAALDAAAGGAEGSTATAAAAAAGLDAMDIDTMIDAAVEQITKEHQQQQQQPEVPADAAAAAAAASAAAAAGVEGASVTRGINQGGGTWGEPVLANAAAGGVGRRSVMGVSRHQLRRLDALRQKLAEQGFLLQQVRVYVVVPCGV